MNNLVWENKGIILGIIRYIVKHIDELVDKIIIIDNDIVRSVLKKLFDDLTFKKKSKKVNLFVINIKNNNVGGLIINNINNLKNINGKIMLLPWYDKDNAIVMFKYNENKEYDIQKIKNKINKFTENKRLNWYSGDNYYNINFIEQKCNFRIWDTYMEYSILKKYVKYYDEYDIMYVYDYITNMLTENRCQSKSVIGVGVPIEVPTYVPTYIPISYKEKQNNNQMKDLLSDIDEKIKLTNNLIELKK